MVRQKLRRSTCTTRALLSEIICCKTSDCLSITCHLHEYGGNQKYNASAYRLVDEICLQETVGEYIIADGPAQGAEIIGIAEVRENMAVSRERLTTPLRCILDSNRLNIDRGG